MGILFMKGYDVRKYIAEKYTNNVSVGIYSTKIIIKLKTFCHISVITLCNFNTNYSMRFLHSDFPAYQNRTR